MKKLLFTLTILAVAALALYLYRPTPHGEPVHYHAGFLVYVDGIKQNFAEAKYTSFTPCSDHTTKRSPAEEQMEKAHLHDMVGDVVHVHREGGTWGDLFQNIRYTLPSDKSLVAYVSGQKIENITKEPIVPDQSIIIVIGDPMGVDLGSYVSLSHIKEVEATSELCGS